MGSEEEKPPKSEVSIRKKRPIETFMEGSQTRENQLAIQEDLSMPHKGKGGELVKRKEGDTKKFEKRKTYHDGKTRTVSTSHRNRP